jgi:fatty-acyl-CoA synthase
MAEQKKFQRTVADQMEMKALDEKVRDQTWLLFRDEETTYRQFYEWSSTYAHLFQKLHKDAKTDDNVRVAVFMDNHPSFIYSLGGCALTAGTCFGVNTGLRGQVLADLVNQARCQIVMCDDRHYDRVHDVRDKLKTVTPDRIFVTDTGEDFTPPEDIRMIHEAVGELNKDMGDAALLRPEVEVPMDSNLMIIYTSGTTGLPKGIRNTHAKLMTIGQVSGMMLVGAKPGDRGYACMPLFHVNSLFLAVMTSFVHNLSVVIKEKFTASGFAPDILKYGVTFWNYVGQPVHYIILALEREYGSEEAIIEAVANHPDNKLKVAFGNGASQIDQDKFIRYFGLDNMMESYGSAEFAIAAVGSKENPRGSVGMVMDPNVQIWNDHGEQCPPAEYDEQGRFLNYEEAVGEIVRVGGPLDTFEGYQDNPEAMAQKIRDGVYHSGDLGHVRVIKGRRYLYFDGRTDDWIRKDGENFSAENVAQVVADFPAVELGVAFGVPCPVSDEWVMVAVKLNEGQEFDPAAFHDYVERQCTGGDMDRKWKPDFVRVVDDFEHTRTQKILVRPLKHEYFNLEWVPQEGLYFFRRGFDSYRKFTDKDYEDLKAEFRENGREQLLETWR